MTSSIIVAIERGCFQFGKYSNLFFYLPDFRGSLDITRARERIAPQHAQAGESCFFAVA
jgi:hypothetical protein